MDIAVLSSVFVGGIGVGSLLFGGCGQPERPCSCECYCAAPIADREESWGARDWILTFLLFAVLVVIIGLATFVVLQFRLVPQIQTKGKGKKGVFGAPLQIRDHVQ